MVSSLLLFVVELGTFKGDVWLAVFLMVSILMFAWTKGQTGDARAAVIYTIVIMLLIFYGHPDLIWVALGLYIFSKYGKEMFKL